MTKVRIMRDTDAFYMKRALELAQQGLGAVSPNPMVGCVIVCNGTIIGEGYHRQYGGPHAEVNAVNDVRDQSLIQEATVYVTLEPCSHVGKTPPCADLLVRHQPKRVVICNTDPNPQVNGRGILKLKQAGIQVDTGVLEEEGKELNKRFFVNQRLHRPYVILKWAQTEDGFIARENYDSKWISNEKSRTLVHQWRKEEDAVMVGTNTALYDNPQLNVRMVDGRDPKRVVLDRSLRLSSELNLFDGTIPTIVVNECEEKQTSNVRFMKVDGLYDRLDEVLEKLYKEEHIGSVIVEGGASLLNRCLEKGLFDEIRRFVAAGVKFHAGIKAPFLSFPQKATQHIDNDQLDVFIHEVN